MIARFAAIADIHGNADALEAVLSDIAGQGVREVVNLGDHLSGPLAAGRTAARLMELGLPSIRGNHDRWLVEQEPAEMGRSDRAAREEIGAAELAWLAALPPVLDWEGVFLCHAVPANDTDYWLERVAPDGTIGLAPQAEIEAAAVGIGADLLLCGHTHAQRAVRLGDGRLVVNPGSVGCPAYSDDTPYPHVMEAGTPHARYAILSRGAAGWDVEFRLVSYDASAMAALARSKGREDWAEAVGTGRISPRPATS